MADRKRNPYLAVVREIRLVLSVDNLLQLLLSAGILFLASFVVLYAFDLYPLYGAGGLTLLYLILRAIRLHADFRLLQRGHPELIDEIETFRDTLDQEGYLIDKLREDLMRRLRSVSNAEFFNYRGLYGKAGLILALGFILLLFTSLNVQFPLLQRIDQVSLPRLALPSRLLPSPPPSSVQNTSGNGSDGVATLNGRQGQLSLQYQSELDLSRTSNATKDKQFTASDVPTVSVGADDLYIETISKQEEEVAKRYFSAIK